MAIGKADLWWFGTVSICANRPAMKALSVLVDKFGFESVFSRIQDGDYHSIASWIADCKDYEEPDVDALEAEILSEQSFSIAARRYDVEYRIVESYPGADVTFENSHETLLFEAVENTKANIKNMDGYQEDKPMFWNIYRMAISECKNARCKALYKIMQGEKEPELPMPTDDDEQPSGRANEKTIIRETVVVKEEPPELEKMLRQAMMEQLVKLNIDDICGEVKKRIIEEFGFEPERHTVKVVDEENEIDEVIHEKFDETAHYVANDIPVYLYGDAGSGKGVLGRHVARALNLDYYFMTSVTDEFKVNGYMDAYGNYHETPFYKAFKYGGVFFLDEMDASAPEVLVCLNMAISDRKYAFPHETVDAHENFRVMAAGNTLGTGADASYTGRMQLDAASLNRFVVVEVDYDTKIDTMCAGGDTELVDFAHEFRKTVKNIGLPSVCSYRNISQIRVAKEAMSLEDALKSCLCKEMNQDDINIVSERMNGNNKYFQAFSNVKAIVG